jgi:glycosyltransferase involved in cell wall biosynthesis
MKKIVFGITSLDIGGAEKVLVDLVNKLYNKYDITIFTIYGNGDLESKINEQVKVITLYNKKYDKLSLLVKKKNSLLFTSKRYLNHVYKKYIKDKFDIEIAFLEGPITSIFACGSSFTKIAWVHTNLDKHIHNKTKRKQYESDYQKYDRIIFVSQDALSGFNDAFKVKVKKQIIHNYMDTDSIVKKANEYDPKEINKNSFVPNFLSVCRLVEVKGIDRLALVSKKLLEEGYKHKVYIVGDGPERKNLEELISKLELMDSFILVGKKDNPYPYMKKCDCFISASLYEGYPTVVIEAMCLGKSIVATDTGAKEALEGYDHKLIVENSFDGLYDGIKQYITDRKRFENNSKLHYDPDKAIDKIISILDGDI